MSEHPIQVLLVSHDPLLCATMAKHLREQRSCLVDTASDAAQALYLSEKPYRVALIDDLLPFPAEDGTNPAGILLMRQIKSKNPYIEAIIFADPNKERALDILQAGAFGYLDRNSDPEELAILLFRAVELQQLKSEVRENQTLLSDAEKRAQDISDVLRVSAPVISNLNLSHTLNAACQSAVELLEVDHSGLALITPDGNFAEVHAEHPAIGALGIKVPLSDVPAEERLVRDKEPLICSDVESDSSLGMVQTILLNLGIRSILVVPVVSNDRVIGSFSLDSIERNREFTEEEIGLCKVFAKQVAVAIENARLFEETKQSIKQLELLRNTALEIISPADRKSLLNTITKQSVRLLNAMSGCIYEYHRERGELTVIADYGHPDVLGTTLKEGEGMAGQLVLSGDSFMIVNDYSKWPGKVSPYAEEDPPKAVLEVPLKLQDETIGVLCVDDEVGREFTPKEAQLLGLLADQAAAALDNSNLKEELREKKDYLERLVVSSPNGITALDTKGRVITFNALAEQILEYKASEIMGNPVEELYFDPQEPREIGRLLRSDEKGILIGYETFVKSSRGEKVPIRLSATWLYGAKGEIVGSVGYFEDIRKFKEVERKLELMLKASDIVAQAENLKIGLQHLAEMIISLIDNTFCRILIFDKEHLNLIVEAAHPVQRSESLKWNPSIGDHIAISAWPGLRRLLKLGDPIVFTWEDETVRPYLEKFSLGLGLENNIRSLLIVPLSIGSKIVGLLNVGEVRGGERSSFTEKEIDLAAAIAAQTTILIDRMRLHDDTYRREQLLSALDKASRQIRGVKETSQLMQSIVSIAADLVGCNAGGIFINRPNKKELELRLVYNLSEEPVITQLPTEKSLIESVARNGESRIISSYFDDDEKDSLLATFDLEAAIAIPIKQVTGDVEAVLFVADSLGERRFTNDDLEILDRFAAQASIALQTSRLIGKEQRVLEQLALLHQISDYIQLEGYSNRIWHAVLTGVTAGYGLGFNRAMLLLLNEDGDSLVGQMGIGQLGQDEARDVWKSDDFKGLDDFKRYLGLWKDELPPITTVGEKVRELQLPVNREAADIFSQVVRKQKYGVFGATDVPSDFRDTFKIVSPIVIVPLVARGEIIGVLVADNKFTQSLITDDDIDMLMAFANTTAIAIDNARLYQRTLRGREKLLSYYQVSSELMSLQDTAELRKAIIDRTLEAADATWASLLLIDEMGRAENPYTAGSRTHGDYPGLIRPEGISMQVMRTGKTVVIEDLNKERERVNPIMLDGETRAAICLPLSLPDKRIGVMWIHYSEPRHFTEFEISAMQLYVNQAAMAYDSARRVRKLENLRKAADDLARADGLPEVLEQIVQSAQDILEANATVLWFYDAERDSFILEGSMAVGIGSGLWDDLRSTVPSKGGTAYTVMNKKWVPVGDIGDERQNHVLGEAAKKLLLSIGARGFQGIKLGVGEETLGVLYAIYNHPCNFTEEEREAALTFANHAALALNKAKLLDQLKKSKKAAEAVAKVTVLGDRNATLTSVTQETMGAVDCDAVVLFEYDKSTQKLKHPPTMIGVNFPEKAMESEDQLNDSFVNKILNLDELHPVWKIADDENFRVARFAQDEEIKSCVAIPLRVGDEKVGVMFVNYRRHRRFTDDELDNIELFANQAAVAIRNAQLFDERSKQLKEQEALVKLSRELLESATSQQTMDRAVAVTADVLGVEYCSIVLPGEDDELIFKSAYGWEKEMIGNFKLSSGRRSQTGFTLRTKAPVNVFDYEKETRFEIPEIIFDRGIKSGLSAPMSIGGEVVGAMIVHTKKRRLFSKEEENLLSLIANETAIAMQSAQGVEAIERKNVHLKALYEASKAITVSFGLNRKEVLDQILNQAVKCTTYSSDDKTIIGSIQIYNEERNELSVESGYPFEKYDDLISVWSNRSLDKNKAEGGKIGISGRAVLERKSQLVRDVRTDDDYFEGTPDTLSELAVPLIYKDKVLGVINVESNKVEGFDEQDRINLGALAELAVIVFHNTQQYQELNKTKSQLAARTSLAWMGMASAAWGHRIGIQANIISDLVKLIHIDLEKKAPADDIEKRLIDIEDAAKEFKKTVPTAPLSTEERVTSVLVYDLIKERMERLWTKETYNSVKYEIDDASEKEATVRASSEWLRRAFDILIDNAVEAMTDLPDKSFKIGIYLKDANLEVSVSDKGKGIPEDVLQTFLREPIKKVKGAKGSGIGILLAQVIIQTYGGDIRMDSTGPEGTTMVFWIPVENDKTTEK